VTVVSLVRSDTKLAVCCVTDNMNIDLSKPCPIYFALCVLHSCLMFIGITI